MQVLITEASLLLEALVFETFLFERFGFALTGAGDVNADGYNDIVIGKL